MLGRVQQTIGCFFSLLFAGAGRALAELATESFHRYTSLRAALAEPRLFMGELITCGSKPCAVIGKMCIHNPAHYEFKWKLIIRGSKPYEFKSEMCIHSPKPFEFIGKPIIRGSKPYALIRKMCIHISKPF